MGDRLVLSAEHSKDPECVHRPPVSRSPRWRAPPSPTRTHRRLAPRCGSGDLGPPRYVTEGKLPPQRRSERPEEAERGHPRIGGCSAGHLVDRCSLRHAPSPASPLPPWAGCAADSCDVRGGRGRAHIDTWLLAFGPGGFNRLGLGNQKSVPAWKPPPSLTPPPSSSPPPPPLQTRSAVRGSRGGGGGGGAKDCCLIAKPGFFFVAEMLPPGQGGSLTLEFAH